MNVSSNDLNLILNALSEKDRIVAITGAGISVSAGLPLGNDEFEGVSVKEILTRPFFVRRPAQFYRWYRHCVLEWVKAAPTRAHKILAAWGVDVITQNIDNLHISAGTGKVIELHGSSRSLFCPRCSQRFPSQYQEKLAVPLCPTCKNVLHPNIVFVGEPVRHFCHAVDVTCRAKLMLVIGTRLTMLPCRLLLEIAALNGIQAVSINEDADVWLTEVDQQMHGSRKRKKETQ